MICWPWTLGREKKSSVMQRRLPAAEPHSCLLTVPSANEDLPLTCSNHTYILHGNHLLPNFAASRLWMGWAAFRGRQPAERSVRGRPKPQRGEVGKRIKRCPPLALLQGV